MALPNNIDKDIEDILSGMSAQVISSTQDAAPISEQPSVSNVATTQNIDNDIQSIIKTIPQQDEAQNPIFQQVLKEELDAPINLPAFQDVTLSFAAGPDGKIEYLKKQYPNSAVEMDQEGNIRIDGKRVEATTPGFDWLMQNSGYALNIVPQIAGSLAGGAAGAVAGAPGAVPGAVIGAMSGAVAGGVAGADLGNALRLGIGKTLGLSTDGQAFVDSMLDETKNAAIGEAISFGLPVAGTAIKQAIRPGVKAAQTMMNKGKAEVAKKMNEKGMSFGQEMYKDILKFVASTDDATATRILQEGPNKVFTDNNVSEMAPFKIAREVLFKDQERIAKIPEGRLDAPASREGLSVGQAEIYNVIKENDQGFNTLITNITDLSHDEVGEIARLGVPKILPEHINNDAFVRLSNRAATIVKEQEEALGKEIAKKVKTYVDSPSNEKFKLGALGARIKLLLNSKDFISGIKEPGLARIPAPDVPGVRDLVELSNLFQGVKEAGNDILSADVGGTKVFIKDLSKRNAVKLNNYVQTKVDSIMEREGVPSGVKAAAKEVRRLFRQEFLSQIGMKDQVEKYAKFAELTDALPKNEAGRVSYFQSRIKEIIAGKNSGINKDNFLKTISAIDPALTKKFNRDLSLYVAGNAMKRVSAQKALFDFARNISKKGFLDPTKATGEEIVFKKASEQMGRSSNPNIRSRVFTDRAMDAVAAKEFTSNSQNLLRMMALLTITGIGTIQAGPLATIAGVAAMTAMQPRRLASYLKSSEGVLRKVGAVGTKEELEKSVKSVAKKVTKPVGKKKFSDRDIALSALGALITRQQSSKSK